MCHETYVYQCIVQTCSTRHVSISALCRMCHKTYVHKCILHKCTTRRTSVCALSIMFRKTYVHKCILFKCTTRRTSICALCRMCHKTYVHKCITQEPPQDVDLSSHYKECVAKRTSFVSADKKQSLDWLIFTLSCTSSVDEVCT